MQKYFAALGVTEATTLVVHAGGDKVGAPAFIVVTLVTALHVCLVTFVGHSLLRGVLRRQRRRKVRAADAAVVTPPVVMPPAQVRKREIQPAARALGTSTIGDP